MGFGNFSEYLRNGNENRFFICRKLEKNKKKILVEYLKKTLTKLWKLENKINFEKWVNFEKLNSNLKTNSTLNMKNVSLFII